jgi:signal transduction histidine kinase
MSSKPTKPRWKPSLFLNLVLWNGAAVLATGLLAVGLMRWTVHRALVAEMDSILVAEAGEIAKRWPKEDAISSDGWRQELEDVSNSRKDLGFFVCLLDNTGQRIWATERTPAKGTFKIRDFTLTPHTVGSNRVVELPIEVQEKDYLVLAGVSVDLLVYRQLALIDQYVAIAVAVILILSPLCAYFVARQATGPLRSMIQQTDRLHPIDISARLSLRGANDELDRLASVINGLLDRIAEYLKKNREMVAYAAHELRSPLAAIRTSIEVAAASQSTPAEQEELLARVTDECSNLQVLVNQLLLLAEVDAGNIGRIETQLRLDEVASKAVDMFEAVAESVGVRLSIEHTEPVTICGSTFHLRQVLNNLIDNAIKYTAVPDDLRHDAKREVSVSLWREKNSAIIEVSDTGIGISPEHLPSIFDRFYRADSARTRHTETQGTGLGLSICQSIVEAHGGTIMASSRQHVGTTMRVQLPIRSDQASPSPRSPANVRT